MVITRSDISTRRADITEPLWVWAIPLLTTTKSNHVHIYPFSVINLPHGIQGPIYDILSLTKGVRSPAAMKYRISKFLNPIAKSCVCTRCFQFDIWRVGFIWGYVDGLVQQRRNSGASSNGEHYVFLALTHRNIHHGTRSRVYHTLTTVDDLVPQGANASADILNTTFSLIFFSLGTGSITLFLTSHNFFKLYM